MSIHSVAKIAQLYQAATVTQNKMNSMSQTAKKVYKTAAGTAFEKLAAGAVKTVLQIKNVLNISTSGEGENNVYYIAKETILEKLFSKNEKELKEEYEFAHTMHEKIKSNPQLNEKDGKNHLIKMEKSDPINGRYTVKTEKADKDLSKELTKEKFNLEAGVEYGRQLLKGFDVISGLGITYHDIKPENCLISNGKLKISDFGKSRWEEEQSKVYTGNMRYAPPEGGRSKAGDVYGLGLVLIGLLEAEFLKDKNGGLIAVPTGELDAPASDKLRGIEKYLVEHKAFQSCESHGWRGVLRSFYRRMVKLGNLEEKEKMAQKAAMESYVEALIKQVCLKKAEDFDKGEELKTLLMSMTDPDPANRPTATEALKKYSVIFPAPENT